MSAPPNILFLHSHNTGRHVEPYGYAAPAPNLQRLAREGVLFRRAFSAAPTCSPSRASVMTGMFPHTCGMLGLAHRGFAMPDYGIHLARTLRRAGYTTALSGVEHTAPDVATIGYDAILCNDDPNYAGSGRRGDAVEAAVGFLSALPKAPFFLSVGLHETHRPFPKAEPERHPAEDPRYCMPPSPLPDAPETRADTADLKAAVRRMDERYGVLLRALERSGLAGRTLVFCFTDHGLQFPRNMCNLSDSGIGVYLVVRGPAGFGGGRVIDAMVSLIDLVPTVCEAVGIAAPRGVQGRSLLPLVSGGSAAHHERILGEVNYHAAYEPARCLRSDRYKYIRRFDDRSSLVLPNVDDTPSKAYLLERGWREQPREREMLYDLVFDPGEAHNLAGTGEAAEVLASLREELEGWMRATDDPLLSGPLPAPPGSRLNDPDGMSPREGARLTP